MARLRRMALVAAVIALIPVANIVHRDGDRTDQHGVQHPCRRVAARKRRRRDRRQGRVRRTTRSRRRARAAPTLRALPKVGVRRRRLRRRRAPHIARRASAAPARRRSPGEGVWHATRPETRKRSRRCCSRPSATSPNTRVSWRAGLDQHKANEARAEPRPPGAVGRTPARGPMEVPPGHAQHLLATFNSGFKLVDSDGGYRSERPHVRADARRAGERSSATPTAALT